MEKVLEFEALCIVLKCIRFEVVKKYTNEKKIK